MPVNIITNRGFIGLLEIGMIKAFFDAAVNNNNNNNNIVDNIKRREYFGCELLK